MIAQHPTAALPLPLRLRLRLPIVAMATVIVLSIVHVQWPIGDRLTLGAFSFLLVFLVRGITSRALLPRLQVWTAPSSAASSTAS